MTTLRKIAAFTLIELLAVITVIAILAALIIAQAGSAAVKSKLQRARGELSTLQTALESYKAQRGAYPPDNTNNPALPQLFYELTGTLLEGTTPANSVYYRIHGGETLSESAFPPIASPGVFGPNVGGFVNSSQVANVNDPTQVSQAEARDFMPSLNPAEYFGFETNNVIIALLGVPIPSPIEYTSTNGIQFTPFRYVSSNPTNNHDAYDLWVEVSLKGKLYRVSNWNTETEVVQ